MSKIYKVENGDSATVNGITYTISNGLIYIQNPKTHYYKITGKSDITSVDGKSHIVAVSNDYNPFNESTPPVIKNNKVSIPNIVDGDADLLFEF